jgi:hypothetical protein
VPHGETRGGVAFDAHSVAAERIRGHQDYVGVRVVLRADVDEARVRVQVDLGFGDAVDSPPQRVTYPSLLDAPAPVVMAYPPEVVIAEKFQVMVDLGMDNSRMKDYFDIDVLGRLHRSRGLAWRALSKPPFGDVTLPCLPRRPAFRTVSPRTR